MDLREQIARAICGNWIKGDDRPWQVWLEEADAVFEVLRQQKPVAAQHRFRHPQKTMPDWTLWHMCEVNNRPAWTIDSQGYEVEYRQLYAAPGAQAVRTNDQLGGMPGKERNEMNDAITLLKMEAATRRSMSTPNQHTITEYTARENERLANQYEIAAEALRQMHNKAFADGILAGVRSMAGSCKALREEKHGDQND